MPTKLSRTNCAVAMRAPSGEIALLSDSAGHFRELAFPFGLVASALVGALATLVVMDCQDSKQDGKQDGKPETFALAAASSGTVVYRQARPPQINEEQGHSDHPYTEQVEASDDLDDDSAPSIFSRAVKTVRFVNPDAPASVGTVATAARGSIKPPMVKFFFFSSRRRHTRWNCDWSSDVCSSDLGLHPLGGPVAWRQGNIGGELVDRDRRSSLHLEMPVDALQHVGGGEPLHQLPECRNGDPPRLFGHHQ